jgi:hypothetical protein
MPEEMAGLREALHRVVQHLDEAAAAAREKEAEAGRRSAEVERALAESRTAEASVRQLLEDMNAASHKARDAATAIFSAVRELNDNMEQVGRDVVVQRERVESTTLAMDQMNEAILEIARNTGSAAESAERSKGNAQAGASGVREAVGSIARVKQRILALKETMTSLGAQAEGIARCCVISDIPTYQCCAQLRIEAARAAERARDSRGADDVAHLAKRRKRQAGGRLLRHQDARENVVQWTSPGDIWDLRLAEDSGGA